MPPKSQIISLIDDDDELDFSDMPTLQPLYPSIPSRKRMTTPPSQPLIRRPQPPVPRPVQPVPRPVQPVPRPVQPVPRPVQPVPRPVQPVPRPVQPVPRPVQPVPRPVQPEVQATEVTFGFKPSIDAETRRSKAIQDLKKDRLDPRYDNLKYVQYALAKLPACEPNLLDKTNKIVEVLEGFQSGSVLFDKSKEYKDNLFFQCIVREIFQKVYEDKYFNQEGIQVLKRTIKNYFDLEFFNEGRFGQVYVASLQKIQNKGNTPFALVKVNQAAEKETEEDLLHEAAIGLCLNKFRSDNYFFPYTYGAFYCSRPTKRNPMACQDPPTTSNLTLMIMTQYIPNTINVSKAAKNLRGNVEATQKFLVNTFLIVAHALSKAQINSKFIHFDLHNNNVLLRPFENNKDVNLTLDNPKGDYSIPLKDVFYTPVIIDFGMATVSNVPMFEGSPNVMLCSSSSSTASPSDRIQFLRCDPSSYFLSTFDIYRFFVDTMLDLYEEYDENKRLYKTPYYNMLNKVFMAGIKPFLDNRDPIPSSRLLYKALRSKSLADFSNLLNDNGDKGIDEIIFGSVRDRFVFQLDINEWIRFFYTIFYKQ